MPDATNIHWTRVPGQGWNLDGTKYGTRWSAADSSEASKEKGQDFTTGREYDVVDLSRNEESVHYFDRASEAKAEAVRLARANGEL